jgi:cell division protein FtsW
MTELATDPAPQGRDPLPHDPGRPDGLAARRGAGPSAPRRVDPVLLGAILLLVALGVVFVYSASAVQAVRMGDEFHFLWRQLLGVGVGLALMVVALRMGTERVARLAYPLLLATLALLVLVPLVGKTAGGARRWIPLGPLNLQPAEIAKVVLVLYLARSLSRKAGRLRSFSVGVLPHLLVTALVAGLCLLQKDMGTGVLLFVVLLTMLFVAGARVYYLFGALLAAAPVGAFLVWLNPYRLTRLLTFLHPELYKHDKTYQLWQSLLGTAEGGWLGVGLGQGKGKLDYLPAAHTDFIAAIIAEEAGLAGILLVIGLFVLLVWRGFRAARRAETAFGCYLAVGLTALLGGQALLNLAVVLGMAPTKGLTLPFVSYGGSSLFTLLGASGLLLAVSAERGGFLARAPAAVRVAAPAPRLPPGEAGRGSRRRGEAQLLGTEETPS